MYVCITVSLCIHTTHTSVRNKNTACRKTKLRGKVILQNAVCLYSINTNIAVEASRSVLTPQTHLISLELLGCVTIALCLMHMAQFLQTPPREGLARSHVSGPSPAALLAHPCSSWRLLALRRLVWDEGWLCMLSEWLPTSVRLIQPAWGRSFQFFGLKHML